MNAVLENLIDHFRAAWRFRWSGLYVAWAVCLLGWAFVIWMPSTYLASARVFVDTRTTLSQVTQGLAVESNLESQLQRVRQALLSAPLLERVARETGLDARAITPQQRRKVINLLRERVDLTVNTQEGASGTYVISYTDTVRERAQKVVESLLNAFVENTMGGKRQSSEQAQRFLVEQIGDYERRLRAAEERLANFKRQNVGMMPGAQGDYFARLQGEMDELDKAKVALAIDERRRNEIQRQLQGEQPLVPSSAQPSALAGMSVGASLEAASPSPVGAASVGAPARVVPTSVGQGSGIDNASRIRETQARLDELSLRFTDDHPDVIALRETLEQLQQRQRQEIEGARRGDLNAQAGLRLSANPVFQSMQLQLNQVEVEMAAVRAQIDDHQARVASLRRLVDTAPNVEAQFARLNRDYDVTRMSYQALLERLERTRLGEEAAATGVVRFEVVDPPSADFAPIAPRRSLLIVFVLLAGIGAGAGIAYLLHQLNPVFSTARQISTITGLPVLATISMTWLEKQRARARKGLIAFGGTAALLLLTAALVLVAQNRAVLLVHEWLA